MLGLTLKLLLQQSVSLHLTLQCRTVLKVYMPCVGSCIVYSLNCGNEPKRGKILVYIILDWTSMVVVSTFIAEALRREPPTKIW